MLAGWDWIRKNDEIRMSNAEGNSNHQIRNDNARQFWSFELRSLIRHSSFVIALISSSTRARLLSWPQCQGGSLVRERVRIYSNAGSATLSPLV